jgi:glycosyltransferase involved in cell wall biosynthesis
MPRVLMGLLFYPRGGSAHVARNLANALPRAGWDVTVLSGSLAGRAGDARAFYRGLDVHPVDMAPALESADPLAADPPFHPSYEDRPGAPDRVFAALDDAQFEHQVAAWSRALQAALPADVLHLHHLTPLNEAAARVAPDAPVVGHLHGTELLMLEAIAQDPGRWPFAAAWRERLRGWAARAERLIVLSDTQVDRAAGLLGIDPARCVLVPNGFDPETFTARAVDRRALWQRYLVDEPRGWAPGAEPGSVSYTQTWPADAPVLLYVGRYTEVKRLPLLIEAYAAARPRFDRRAPLVIVGGFPGEWEGEHPLQAIERVGAEDVFLAGWHEHDELADVLNASDAVVLPSVREQFGQVLVEGMACGLPAIAVNAWGPAGIVKPGETGWLVEPDDAGDLADALVEAVNRPDERRRRGEAAARDARARFAWPSLAGRVARVYETAMEPPERAVTSAHGESE